MQKLERIPINIWDDFHEDGYVPEGEKQETYIYVEDSNIPQEKRKECLELLLSTMCGLNFVGVKMWLFFYDSRIRYPMLDEMYHFERWEIRVENLTHERLSKLLVELNSANLSVDGIPFEIYSES